MTKLFGKGICKSTFVRRCMHAIIFVMVWSFCMRINAYATSDTTTVISEVELTTTGDMIPKYGEKLADYGITVTGEHSDVIECNSSGWRKKIYVEASPSEVGSPFIESIYSFYTRDSVPQIREIRGWAGSGSSSSISYKPIWQSVDPNEIFTQGSYRYVIYLEINSENSKTYKFAEDGVSAIVNGSSAWDVISTATPSEICILSHEYVVNTPFGFTDECTKDHDMKAYHASNYHVESCRTCGMQIYSPDAYDNDEDMTCNLCGFDRSYWYEWESLYVILNYDELRVGEKLGDSRVSIDRIHIASPSAATQSEAAPSTASDDDFSLVSQEWSTPDYKSEEFVPYGSDRVIQGDRLYCLTIGLKANEDYNLEQMFWESWLVPNGSVEIYDEEISVDDGWYDADEGVLYLSFYMWTEPCYHSLDNIVAVEGVSPTCTTEGTEAHYICNICEGIYSDEYGHEEIMDKDSLVIPELGHAYETSYIHDETNHWHKCKNCTATTTAEAHIYDNATDTTCNICGYTRTITTPDAGGSGSSGGSSSSNGRPSSSSGSSGSGGGGGSSSRSASKSTTSTGSSQPNTEGSWKQNTAGWTFQKTDGSYSTNEWERINGSWYYFGGTGYMTTGWQAINGSWYYMDTSVGNMQTGWLQQGQTWYYLNTATEGVEGSMATGWKAINGSWYYMNTSVGNMQTGWLQLGQTWYYLNTATEGVEGSMVTGWKLVGGKYYYFDASGAMLANTTTPDGYKVDASGAWIQ